MNWCIKFIYYSLSSVGTYLFYRCVSLGLKRKRMHCNYGSLRNPINEHVRQPFFTFQLNVSSTWNWPIKEFTTYWRTPFEPHYQENLNNNYCVDLIYPKTFLHHITKRTWTLIYLCRFDLSKNLFYTTLPRELEH